MCMYVCLYVHTAQEQLGTTKYINSKPMSASKWIPFALSSVDTQLTDWELICFPDPVVDLKRCLLGHPLPTRPN